MKEVLLAIWTFVSITSCEKPTNCSSLMIMKVGGCDNSGSCTAMMSDGKSAYIWSETGPVEGNMVKVCTFYENGLREARGGVQ